MVCLQLRTFIVVFITLLNVSNLTAQSSQGLEDLQRGLKLFEEKKFDSALEAFNDGLKKDPQNTTFLFNMGMTSLKLNQNGYAAAYLRKARELDPYSTDLREALDEFTKQVQMPTIPRQISSWDLLVSSLRQIPRIFFFLLVLGFTVGTGFLVLRRARLARAADRSESGSIFVPLLVTSVCLLGSVILYGIRLYDGRQARGTIISEKVGVKSLPKDDAPEIVEFYQTMEVKVLETQDGWHKVQYPGSFLGWVKADALMINTPTSVD